MALKGWALKGGFEGASMGGLRRGAKGGGRGGGFEGASKWPAPSPSPLPCAPASVASLSTLWATTVQRAHVRVFWGSEGGLWRVLQHGSAAKVEVE